MRYVGRIVETQPGEFRVWAEEQEPTHVHHTQIGGRYVGPVAEVYADADFVTVSTDPHEGVAMINREALPQLIEALQRLEAYLQQQGK